MKKTAFSLLSPLSLTLMATILTSAVWTASGAPKMTPKVPPTNPAAGAATSAATASAPKTGTVFTAPGVPDATGTEFTASRFPGVSVRHVPSASPPRSAQTGASEGIVLKNMRPAPDPQGGFMADIDASSYPTETAKAKSRFAKKARRRKAVPKTAARAVSKKHQQ